MDNAVLIAYATRHGATAEIAEVIGEVLRDAGLPVDVRPAERAGDLRAYGAVVLGSAVYIGQWHRKATRFLKTNEAELAAKPVWLFSSGPTGEGDPVDLLQGWRLPAGLQPVADRIRPRDVAVFAGELDADRLNVLEKWMVRKVEAPLGDFRDWKAILSWARAIATGLKEAGLVPEPEVAERESTV